MYVNRHGKEVEEIGFSSLEDAVNQILFNVNLDDEGYETAAVLTMTEKEALDLYCMLKAKRRDVSYIDRNSSRFKKGITVTTFYMAKGLEFDQVFVMGGKKENSLYRQFQYISATRALHELYVLKLL